MKECEWKPESKFIQSAGQAWKKNCKNEFLPISIESLLMEDGDQSLSCFELMPIRNSNTVSEFEIVISKTLAEKMSAGSTAQNLPSTWIKPKTNARLHILRAHRSSKAVIIRRKPSKCVHIISWDTYSDTLEYGSWFRGRIYAERCDLSWDGHWMVYLAMGSGGDTWNGICEVPWLSTFADVPNMGTWAGGGFFSDSRILRSNDNWCHERSLSEFSKSKEFPFSIEHMESGGEAFPILSHRLERDGWKREGDFGKNQEISLKHSSYATLCVDDPGWSWQPSPKHPVLRMYFRGYLVHGYTFEFCLEDSDILDPEVDWATWNAKGDLLVAREGSILRYTLEDLKSESPTFSTDLEQLSPANKSRPTRRRS